MLTDRELVERYKKGESSAVEILHDRYENLIHKQWSILRKQLQNSPAVLNAREDFYSDCLIALYKSLAAVDLNVVQNDAWKLLGYLRWYIMSVRNDYIRRIISTSKKEEDFYISNHEGDETPKIDLQSAASRTKSPEDLYVEAESQREFALLIESKRREWSPTKQLILNERLKGTKKSDIAKMLGITPAAITHHLRMMKKDLQQPTL